ncbi:hypothetical protein LX36DRAFT_712994 [Colletotrichum falcatum]|nr:hypothetical protein LX36DRAFT_712994 [Colletotrichum falcatum]
MRPTPSPYDLADNLSILLGPPASSPRPKTSHLGGNLGPVTDSLFETPSRKRPADSPDIVLELSDTDDDQLVHQSQNADAIARDLACKPVSQLSSDARLTDGTMWLLCEALRATEAGPGCPVSDALWLDPEDAAALERKYPDREFRLGNTIYTPTHHSVSQHWTLCIFKLVSSAVDVDFIDSAPSHERLRHMHQNLSTWLSRRGGSRGLASFTKLQSPQQQDATNCGVYVLHSTRQLLAGKPLDEAIDAEEARQGLLQMILDIVDRDRLPQTAAMAFAEIQAQLFANKKQRLMSSIVTEAGTSRRSPTRRASSAIVRSRPEHSKNRLALLETEPDIIKARLSLVNGARIKAEQTLEHVQAEHQCALEVHEKAGNRREMYVKGKEGLGKKARDAHTQATSALAPRLEDALESGDELLAGFFQTSIDVLSGQLYKFEADLEAEDKTIRLDHDTTVAVAQRASGGMKQHTELLDRLSEDELQLQRVLTVLVQLQSIGDVDIIGLLARTREDG